MAEVMVASKDLYFFSAWHHKLYNFIELDGLLGLVADRAEYDVVGYLGVVLDVLTWRALVAD